jgi:outer membrane biosynthesis protein TonB
MGAYAARNPSAERGVTLVVTMLGDARSWPFLLASLLLHLALALAIVVGVLPSARSRSHARDRADSWSGDTFEVDAVLGTGAPKAVAAPQPAAPPAAERPAEVTPPEPAKRPEPKTDPKPTPADPPSDEPAAKRQPAVRYKPDKPAESEHERPAKRETTTTAAAGPSDENDLRAAMAAAAAGTGGPRYGAAGLEPGVRNLAKAFTRAIPASSDRDPVWSSLPLGAAGSLSVSIAIDDDGRIESVQMLDKVRPPQLIRLVEKTVLLLRGGQFALSREGTTAKTEVLELEASIAMSSPSDDPMEKGNRPPTPGHPGRAFFRQSGRTIEVRVSLDRD